MGLGSLPHAKMLRPITLLGEKVAPLLRSATPAESSLAVRQSN
jgi:hypothetical protein